MPLPPLPLRQPRPHPGNISWPKAGWAAAHGLVPTTRQLVVQWPALGPYPWSMHRHSLLCADPQAHQQRDRAAQEGRGGPPPCPQDSHCRARVLWPVPARRRRTALSPPVAIGCCSSMRTDDNPTCCLSWQCQALHGCMAALARPKCTRRQPKAHSCAAAARWRLTLGCLQFVEQLDMLDPDRECTTYWQGKAVRDQAIAGLPLAGPSSGPRPPRGSGPSRKKRTRCAGCCRLLHILTGTCLRLFTGRFCQ